MPTTITPAEAARLLRQGATLVDVREPAEYQRERVPGSRNLPLSRLEGAAVAGAGPVLFLCQSGARTAKQADRLAVVAGERDWHIVAGGLEAWRRAGLAVEEDRSAPLPLMRQAQIGAGALVLLGVLLAAFVHPAFVWLAGLVGAGLLTAGVTGFCGMAEILARMPWNRVAASA